MMINGGYLYFTLGIVIRGVIKRWPVGCQMFLSVQQTPAHYWFPYLCLRHSWGESKSQDNILCNLSQEEMGLYVWWMDPRRLKWTQKTVIANMIICLIHFEKPTLPPDRAQFPLHSLGCPFSPPKQSQIVIGVFMKQTLSNSMCPTHHFRTNYFCPAK